MKYNLSKYNLSKYNLGDSGVKIEGHTTIDVFCQIVAVTVERKVSSASAMLISAEANSSWVLEKKSGAQISEIEFISIAEGQKMVVSSDALSDLELNSFAKGSLLGEEFIEISNLSLAKGDEIEIDLCSLTVLVNNEDYVGKRISGEFFELLSGINEIDIEAVEAQGIEIDITWKDRWL